MYEKPLINTAFQRGVKVIRITNENRFNGFSLKKNELYVKRKDRSLQSVRSVGSVRLSRKEIFMLHTPLNSPTPLTPHSRNSIPGFARILFGLFACAAFFTPAPSPAAPTPPSPSSPGATEILKWKDGKQAALVLMFDDNIDSHQRNAVPALEQRHLKGVFYINPEKSGFMAKPFWQKELPALGHEYGVHTMTHKVTDEVDAAWEIGECAPLLRKIHPASPTSPLLSYGRPGGTGAFMVSDQVEADLLKKNQLIHRGPFLMYLNQDVPTLDKWLDGVIKKGDDAKILFHGVGGDYLSVKMEVFNPFLDHIVARQDRLWVAGHMPIHKYATERQTAKVAATSSTPQKIVLTLTTQADPALYDQPLTLRTRVPADWTNCRVTQGKTQQTITPVQGVAQFEARPGAQPITLEK